MTSKEREKWGRIRARGRARYILLSLLIYGVPMWVIQNYGPLLYDAITHAPPTPRFHNYPPTLFFAFDFVLWIFVFGSLMGESIWQKHERDFGKDDTAS